MKPYQHLLLFLIPISYFSLTACNSFSLKKSIISSIQKTCETDRNGNCSIELRNITPFEWDRIYIFPDWTITDSISSYLKIIYHGQNVPDDYYRIVFTHKNEIVYEEDIAPLDYRNSTIIFELGDSARYFGKPIMISAGTFNVRRDKTPQSCSSCYCMF
jgi:hypothetical protein